MNKKKGFTLIELIGVIVLLTIIALIAIPTIMKLINEGIKKSFVSSAYGIIKAGDLYYSRKDMMGEPLEETIFEFPNNTKDLEYDGSAPQSGSMVINEDGDIALAITNGKYCLRKGYNESEVIFDIDINDCYVYEEEEINKAVPEVKTGMISVVISNDGTVKKSHTTSKWYSYSEKMWANVVTVTEEAREKYMNANIGTEIKEEDILTYFVWIPRYKYKLWYVEAVNSNTELDTNKPHSIDIVFENNETKKSTGSENREYLTHPAFTFGSEELNGIWVGKFETGFNGTGDKNIKDTTKIIIKPNVSPWNNINLSNAFYTTKGMNKTGNIFGLEEDSDSHIMKNIEWGAVAYLSHSEYGTCKDGVCHSVYKNTRGKTGCGSNSANESFGQTCINGYGTLEDGEYYQSTNENISGVFDMNGGASETMMTMGINSANVNYASSGFDNSTFPDSKYVDIYNTSGVWAYSYRLLGDATGEMGPFNNNYLNSWYQEYAHFITNSSPCFSRGGNVYVDNTGIFQFDICNCSSVAFRITIA